MITEVATGYIHYDTMDTFKGRCEKIDAEIYGCLKELRDKNGGREFEIRQVMATPIYFGDKEGYSVIAITVVGERE